MYFLLKIGIFHCYVSLPECNLPSADLTITTVWGWLPNRPGSFAARSWRAKKNQLVFRCDMTPNFFLGPTAINHSKTQKKTRGYLRDTSKSPTQWRILIYFEEFDPIRRLKKIINISTLVIPFQVGICESTKKLPWYFPLIAGRCASGQFHVLPGAREKPSILRCLANL